MDALFAALGDPVRLAIVQELAERNDQALFELCVRLITAHELAVSRQAVAKHVRVLREAGLVELSSRGRTTIHHLDVDALRAARALLDHLITKAGTS